MSFLPLVMLKVRSGKNISQMTASTPLLLCGGEQADLSDADGLMEASNEEPGLLAFKSTSVTRWSKHLPWLIELHSGNQGRTEPKVSTIAEIATFESNYIMVLSTPYTQSFSLAFSP
nr:uncharacterized protein LOC127340893 isoform X7 [Lolium perenne]XP_051222617.1 uncharacterized protein LOC127340893 isoform X8 [Lolium perenne]XP_051222618.1 uncharacterized protein LOC127340893 isoform X9 [Lolium perenne]XP_051222619.1 uncharacterized protein LOC127340893 isoform X10 [Lolium perenne]XP_051222620.1 uncharacterized protein LOC127340893 isoform X11 [Lolium perenne]